jgi:hypothetical protein
MQWKDINFSPTTSTLRQFSALWIVFFGGLAALNYWSHARPVVALALAVIGVVAGTIGLVFPAAMFHVYRIWMALAFPIGWTVSHVVLALVYFGFLTPLRFVFQLTGRDVLRLRRQSSTTYWVRKTPEQDLMRYLRQY